METIYQSNGEHTDPSTTKYTGGFIIGGVEKTSLFNDGLDGRLSEIQGGSSNRFKNKVIPFGLAMKRTKPMIGYECKNGDILDNHLFEKLFTMVAKVEKREKNINKKNKTKRIKK